jgi:hypothetical protein
MAEFADYPLEDVNSLFAVVVSEFDRNTSAVNFQQFQSCRAALGLAGSVALGRHGGCDGMNHRPGAGGLIQARSGARIAHRGFQSPVCDLAGPSAGREHRL